MTANPDARTVVVPMLASTKLILSIQKHPGCTPDSPELGLCTTIVSVQRICSSSACIDVQEKAKREERDRLNKEAKAAEAQKKQADAKRLAGERAEEREKEKKRKLEQASQVTSQIFNKSISQVTLSTVDVMYSYMQQCYAMFLMLPCLALPFCKILCLTCIVLPGG